MVARKTDEFPDLVQRSRGRSRRLIESGRAPRLYIVEVGKLRTTSQRVVTEVTVGRRVHFQHESWEVDVETTKV